MTEQIFLSITQTQLRQLIREETRRAMSEAGLLQALGRREELLNVEQAAKLLSLSISSLYRLTSRQQIPFFKKGKQLYFRREELVQWLEQGRSKENGV